MNRYKNINNLFGWLTFVVAATVYCLTIEPTASFWDCPEFILSGYKLEVGHPPGAPFFMLTANLFSQFADSPATVAKMVNYMSALMSAACILFLFWSITHLVRNLVVKDKYNITTGQIATIIGSGLVGALIYTFSDTFWFSAVEGEVYAYSSLFTALVFWLILKWEDVAEQPHSDRWLVLIAYLTGLSIGVHLLNLLCLPAIVLVYYYKKVPNANFKGSLMALVVSALLVAAVLYGIVPGVVKVGGWFELLFVNGLGASFNTGVVIYTILLALAIIWAVYESYTEKNKVRMNLSFILTVALSGIPFYGHGATSVIIGIILLGILAFYLYSDLIPTKWKLSTRTLNTTLLSIMMIMMGYSSYALIVIRSTANTPMDQNSPEDIFTLGEYLGREQYGTRPLFYGQTYASRVEFDIKNGYCVPVESSSKTKYVRKEKASTDEKDQYVEIPGAVEYKYGQNMLFPRMYSSAHANEYNSWVNVKGHNVVYDNCGEEIMLTIPTQWENIKFFFRYQLNFMYWRYFLWNFAGRQNDIQGNGEIEHGNWITGIPFIDNVLVGNQQLLPTELKENKGHNVYYCLPLLLGILGLLWQAYRGGKGVQQFWVVFFLFFMTGIAIVLYLNQTPSQPRERDYAYAGSFYAFAIWTGMGVAAIINFLRKHIKMKELPAALVASLVCLLVPIQMAGQNWDDHDRSNRYVARDFGQNYLMTLPEKGNPVIFTNGDNDTFPLWYNQETEGVRTDARTCNLSYLQTDWYIDQMRRPAYNSPALPINWDRIEYVEGTNDYVRIRPDLKKQIQAMYDNAKNNPDALKKLYKEFGENPFELKNILKFWIRSKNPALHVIPTDTIVMKVDKDAVRRSGMMIPKALGDSIPDYMYISLLQENGSPRPALIKNQIMMLELLSNTNWERPMYMAITVGRDSQLGMDKHFIQEGLAYRFTPFNTALLGSTMDTEKMYNNIMNKFVFGGIDNPGVYLDENSLRMCYTHRRIIAQLIIQLLNEGQVDKATKALELVEKKVPEYNVKYDWQNGAMQLAEAYYRLDKANEANRIMEVMAQKSIEYITWYLSLSEKLFSISSMEVEYHISLLHAEVKAMEKFKSELSVSYAETLDQLYSIYYNRIKNKL